MSGEQQVGPELVERLVDLARQVAEYQPHKGDGWFNVMIGIKAEAIVAELPAPIDPDLIEAREIAADVWAGKGAKAIAAKIRCGNEDTSSCVQAVLIALKRGRELAEAAMQVDVPTLTALRDLKPILDMAESNASGMHNWPEISRRVKAARAAIKQMEVRNGR